MALGHHKNSALQHGFDEYFGIPYSNDMWPYHPACATCPWLSVSKMAAPAVDRGQPGHQPQSNGKDQEQITTQLTERSVRFIEKNKDKPFFLYVPHPMVHVPLYVSDKFKGKSKAGLFGDVMMEVDWSVGQIRDPAQAQARQKHTGHFTSDNGPWLSYGDHAGSAGPLREGKGTMFDGGCRESALMWWPGTIPAGSECPTPAMTIDLLPTVAELIGARLPMHPIDGKSIVNLLKGTSDTSPHEAYYFYYGRQLQAIRMGKWKLHFPHGYRTMAGRPGGTDGIHLLQPSQDRVGVVRHERHRRNHRR